MDAIRIVRILENGVFKTLSPCAVVARERLRHWARREQDACLGLPRTAIALCNRALGRSNCARTRLQPADVSRLPWKFSSQFSEFSCVARCVAAARLARQPLADEERRRCR